MAGVTLIQSDINTSHFPTYGVLQKRNDLMLQKQIALLIWINLDQQINLFIKIDLLIQIDLLIKIDQKKGNGFYMRISFRSFSIQSLL